LPVTIAKVGVVGALDPDTREVSSIMAHRRRISTNYDPRGGTRTTENGKVEGNEELECGANSSTPNPQQLPLLALEH
jgi:hypothetical protein